MSTYGTLVKTVNTVSEGGSGGKTSFTISKTVNGSEGPEPLAVRKVIMYTNSPNGTSSNYIKYITVTFVDGSTISAGKSDTSYPYTFSFSEDETIDQCILFRVHSGSGLAALSFTTSQGRGFVAGDNSQPGNQLSIKGSMIYGFFGTFGDNIDSLGLIVDVPITELVMTDIDFNVVDVSPTAIGPIALDQVALSNSTTVQQTLSLVRSFSSTASWNFSVTGGLKVGAKATIVTKIPFIAEGKVEVSGEVSASLTYGQTHSHTETFQYTAQVNVPAGHQVKALVTATQGRINVNYNGKISAYYQDGTTATKAVTGVFNGVNDYDIIVEYSNPESADAVLKRRSLQLAASAAS